MNEYMGHTKRHLAQGAELKQKGQQNPYRIKANKQFKNY